MATPSRLDDVIAALVVMFDAALTVPVYDGPVPTSTPGAEYVLVGSDGDTDSADSDGASTDREWSSMGNRWVEETGEVLCAVWASSGDTDIAAVRVSAFALLASLEAAVLADPALGGLLIGPDVASIPRTALRQWQTSSGAIVRLVFTVRYGALLN